MDGCAYFSYWPDSADCYFSADQAEMQPSSGAVGGLGVCPEPGGGRRKACTKERPGNGFPGFTGKASNEAWESGKQPRSLECWPKNDTGGYMSCKQVTILEDTEASWPGKCRALAKRNGTFAQCAEDCKQNPLCPSWQTGNAGCWQGLGIDCFVRVEFTPIRAQRLQHGSVRVLMNLTGWQIVGLAKSFDNGHGYFLRTEDAITACKKVCYSDIRCQYWQYTPRYGCWVEDASAGFHPPWPLTTEWAYRSTPFALDCVAGEYIQHTCPPGMESPFAPLAQERLSSCMHMGYDYDPPDMRWQSETVEMGAESCQERCKSTKGCASFTYWPTGSCHLQDDKAVKVVAKDYRVIAGPVTCGAGRTTTPKPAEVKKQPHPKAAPVLQSSPGPAVAGDEDVTVAEIMVDITNLAFKSMHNTTMESLKSTYTTVLANQLGVQELDIRRKPRGQENRGSVLLLASTYGSALENSPQGTLLVAYLLNKPPTSTDVSWIRSKVQSAAFKQAIVMATHRVMAEAVNVHNKQEALAFFNQHPEINATEKIYIDLSQVHALTGHRHINGTKDSKNVSCGFACRWWPLAVGLLILLCTGGLAAGAVYYGKKAKPKKKKRGAKATESSNGHGSPQESTASSRTAMRSLDVTGMSLDSHATAARQEAMPLVGNMYPQPMNAMGREVFNSQQSLPSRKRHGEFYV